MGNRIVIALLRSPLHRTLSGSLLLLTYTGRRSGEPRALPVMYARRGDRLIVFAGRPAGKRWWRNFDGAPARVRARERGRWIEGDAQVVREPARVADARHAYVTRFPKAAKSLGDDAVLVEIVSA